MSLLTSIIPAISGVSAAASKSVSGTETVPAADLGPSVIPCYQVTETADAYRVTVQLPGVAKDGVEVSVDAESVRIVGRRAWRKPEAWTALHREIPEANFSLVLEHGRTIEAETIQAELRDGQLRISLNKAGSLKPRRIAVA